MRRSKPFRPTLGALEGRALPTASPYPDAFRSGVADAYAAQAAEAANPVVFLGDSITLGWGNATAEGPGSASFRADFAPLGAANFGIAGDTTANLLDRVGSGELAGRPRVAVVMVGINDLIDGSTAEQAAAGVAAVVGAIHAESPATEVLLLGVLPTQSTAFNARVDRLDALISPLGSQPGVTYVDLRADLLGGDGAARPELMRDTFHPAAAGYDAIAGAIDAALVGILDPAPATVEPSAPADPAPAATGAPAALLPMIPDATATPRHKTAPGGLAVGPVG